MYKFSTNRLFTRTLTALVSSLISLSCHTAPTLAGTYYLDERGHNTTSLVYSSKALPGGLTFWGFTDFHSSRKSSDGRSDINSFFTEARLSKMLGKSWGAQLEYNDTTGDNNNLGRLGLLYKVPVDNTLLILRAFPFETDGDGGQVSAIWRRTLLENKLYFEGFADYNVSDNGRKHLVAEPQIRYMIGKQFGLCLEYRYNEFLKSKQLEHRGIALGMHYNF